MLSSVFLTGRLGEKLDDKVRYVEVDRVIPGPTGKFLTDKLFIFHKYHTIHRCNLP